MAKLEAPSRAQLQAFIKEQRTILALEALFNAVASGRVEVQAKTGNYSIASEDSGATFLSTAADTVFTLPATALGLIYTVVSKVPSAGMGVKVVPAAGDKIMGNGFTSLDGKAAINAGATDREGDIITFMGDGLDGWFITGVIGVWVREA